MIFSGRPNSPDLRGAFAPEAVALPHHTLHREVHLGARADGQPGVRLQVRTTHQRDVRVDRRHLGHRCRRQEVRTQRYGAQKFSF